MSGRTFSESWHHVADQKISLRPTIRVRKQIFRGTRWYVLQDPFNNQFFRLRPSAYDFLKRLRPDRTVEQAWNECLEQNPEEAPGQEDVIQLLSQLYFANLLYYEIPADSAKLFERYKKRKQRELQSKLLSIMFIRIPLFDPDNLLKDLMPLIKILVGPIGAILWLAVVGFAFKVSIDHFDELASQVQGILAPDNLIFLYLGLVVIKTLHEFGHAMVCRRYGGEVHTMGVMFLIFTPLPYMDATSSWSFRSQWQRAFVGAAGMITEIFTAGIAAITWAYTGPGIIHSLAYNMMFIASVSTVLFNANPLLRFDGYYILSDLLDIPNLHTQSLLHLKHFAERYLFGDKESYSPTQSLKEAIWLSVFGVASWIYRVIVFTGIILFIADRFLLAGLIMAFTCVISWGVVPIYRLSNYLLSSPKLVRRRTRAILVSIGGMSLIVFFLAIFPFPNRFRAPGILEAENFVKVVNDAPGYIEEILVTTGSRITKGTPLLLLSNKELHFKIKAALAQRDETLAMQARALRFETADLEPILKRLDSVEKKLKNLESQLAALTVTARTDGIWVFPNDQEMVGSWVDRGSDLGVLIYPEKFRFSAIVTQDEASNLFAEQIRKAEVRLFGQGKYNLTVQDFEIIPFQHETLPSAAIGWRAGGEVPVSVSDETGRKAAEPFFQIYARLSEIDEATLYHGSSGKLRFTLPSKPLLSQWSRKLRQILQKRYQI